MHGNFFPETVMRRRVMLLPIQQPALFSYQSEKDIEDIP